MAENEEVLSAEELTLPNDVQAQLRIGRTAAKKAEALEAQVKSLELQGAIKDAGVPDHPARDVVFKDYDGPLDAESLRAYAEKFGLVAIQPDGVTDADIAGQRQILNASGGAPAPSADVDLAVAMRNAKTKEEVLALVAQAAGTPGFRNRDGLIGVMPEPY